MFEVLSLVVGFGGGLITGWWFFPQPEIVQEWYAKLFNK